MSRRMMAGRSVSRINGETVPISLLKEAAAILIDIHGQHEHQSLLYRKIIWGLRTPMPENPLRRKRMKRKACSMRIKL